MGRRPHKPTDGYPRVVFDGRVIPQNITRTDCMRVIPYENAPQYEIMFLYGGVRCISILEEHEIDLRIRTGRHVEVTNPITKALAIEAAKTRPFERGT